MTFDPYPS